MARRKRIAPVSRMSGDFVVPEIHVKRRSRGTLDNPIPTQFIYQDEQGNYRKVGGVATVYMDYVAYTSKENTFTEVQKSKSTPDDADGQEIVTADFLPKKTIIKTGLRGEIGGYETAKVLTGDQTITKESPDTITMSTNGTVTLTFVAAGENDTATKVISLLASGNTTLKISGATWANNAEKPTWGSSGQHLILVAHFISGRVVLAVFHNSGA